MNSKTAKRLRHQCRQRGFDPRDARTQATIPSKKWAAPTQELLPDCGRYRYKVAKQIEKLEKTAR